MLALRPEAGQQDQVNRPAATIVRQECHRASPQADWNFGPSSPPLAPCPYRFCHPCARTGINRSRMDGPSMDLYGVFVGIDYSWSSRKQNRKFKAANILAIFSGGSFLAFFIDRYIL